MQGSCWFDVFVAVVAAFGAGVLAGIALYGDDQLIFWFEAPHGIEEVAGILGAEFKPKLAAHGARSERRFGAGAAEIREICFDVLRGGDSHEGTHLGDVDGKVMLGILANAAFGHAELCMGNSDPFDRWTSCGMTGEREQNERGCENHVG
jgi:hypothetical protein